jgi:hypothetical protein
VYANPILLRDPSGFTAEEPYDIALIHGFGVSFGVAAGGGFGVEAVYDLWDFEFGIFSYGAYGVYGNVGYVNIPQLAIKARTQVSASISEYTGYVSGWKNFDNDLGIANYEGASFSVSANVAVPGAPFLGVSGTHFRSPSGELSGLAVGMGVGVDKLSVGVNIMFAEYELIYRRSFKTNGCITIIDGIAFAAFIQATHTTAVGNVFARMAIENSIRWSS